MCTMSYVYHRSILIMEYYGTWWAIGTYTQGLANPSSSISHAELGVAQEGDFPPARTYI